MAQDNNKRAIVKSWKDKYSKNHNPIFAAKVEAVTGETPDFINGLDDGEPPVAWELLELVNEHYDDKTNSRKD